MSREEPAPPVRYKGGSAELAKAILKVAEEVRALRDAVAGDGEFGRRLEFERIIHGLTESVDELEADLASLRSENERLLAVQEQIGSALRAATGPRADDPAATAAELNHLLQENTRLHENLERARDEEERTRAMLRTIDSSRAWKLVSFYWAWARRIGRGRTEVTTR